MGSFGSGFMKREEVWMLTSLPLGAFAAWSATSLQRAFQASTSPPWSEAYVGTMAACVVMVPLAVLMAMLSSRSAGLAKMATLYLHNQNFTAKAIEYLDQAIGGVAQVVLLSEAGATSVAPRDGTLLWGHAWKQGMRIVQPALTQAGDVLIGTGDGQGLRRVAVAHGSGGWTVEERWASAGLKPHFNDFVVHEGHAFGFDGRILSCVDVEDDTRKWKGGRYGHGQLVVLPDQDLLLVLSEEGEVALVSATPNQFTELGRFPVIEGKTWNHPVLIGDILLVRNGQEMAAFRLSLASR